ncbi:MAG: single-stranded DNA-binding protein [Anaerolineaceae bacterium]|nr:single-stranded DNA-binding protein [Anaerolineaceae bacterium]MBN2677411.1 single-stranded DNA-binding protein [Anaerolineaceae bacterium]
MFHTIIILGNVGKDPELRYTPSGQGVTTFSVASNRQYNSNDGQQVKETIWFRITAWGKTAEVCNQYLHKGMRVFIEGRLRPDTNGSPRVFQRADGTNGSSYEVVATTVKFISPRTESEAPGGEEFESSPSTSEEDIPF